MSKTSHKVELGNGITLDCHGVTLVRGFIFEQCTDPMHDGNEYELMRQEARKFWDDVRDRPREVSFDKLKKAGDG